MNCIDAIEGVAKEIIVDIHQAYVENQLDDTEYARSVRSVIEGSHLFVVRNQEVTQDPELLKQVLFEFSRNLWLTGCDEPPDQLGYSEDNGYKEYYFDHIYRHGVYPG